MQPEFHSGAVTRPLSAILQLAMMGCLALRARGELAAGACAPVLGWDRGGSSSAGGLVAQGRGGRCVVSLDAFLSRGCENKSCMFLPMSTSRQVYFCTSRQI